MTALAMDIDMRELSVDEIDSVAGGSAWVLVAGVAAVVVVVGGGLAVGFFGAHNKAKAEAKAGD